METATKEFKGTKGEWKAVKLPYKVGLCTHEIQFNEDGECVTDGVYGEANAKLIAAAPDLLEACMEFVRKVECGEAKSKRSYAQMKQAIEKAL